MSVFSNSYFFAVGVPLVFLFIGALAKKIVRATTWELKDWFLGVESTLAAMASGLINIFDLVKAPTSLAQNGLKLAATGGFLTINMMLLFVVLGVHQDWENKPAGKAQAWWLGVFSNVVGLSLMVSFILVIKGVD
jgi:hypothetical protein